MSVSVNVETHRVFVSAREWWDRQNGSTYSSIKVSIDGVTIGYVPFYYGHGDLTHLHCATDLLAASGFVLTGPSTRRIGVDVADVSRKKDLHLAGRGGTHCHVGPVEFVCIYSPVTSPAFDAAGLDFDTHGEVFARFLANGMGPADAAEAACLAVAPVAA